MPTKKFAFKRKARKAPAAQQIPTPAASEEQKSDPMPAVDIVNIGNHLLIKDLQDDQNIMRTAAEYEGKENVIVENLKNCVVILPFSIKCIYMKNI